MGALPLGKKVRATRVRWEMTIEGGTHEFQRSNGDGMKACYVMTTPKACKLAMTRQNLDLAERFHKDLFLAPSVLFAYSTLELLPALMSYCMRNQ